MTISLLNNHSTKNTVGKTYSTIGTGSTFQFYLEKNQDISNPIITINIKDNPDFIKANYCLISKLNRFYFIERIEYLNTDIVIMYLHVDVLESFKEYFLQYQAQIDRCEDSNYYNLMLYDDMLPMSSQVKVKQTIIQNYLLNRIPDENATSSDQFYFLNNVAITMFCSDFKAGG